MKKCVKLSPRICNEMHGQQNIRFKQFFIICHLSLSWKEANAVTVPTPGKKQTQSLYRRPERTQNFILITLRSTAGKLFRTVTSQLVQSHVEEINLLNPRHFDCLARHANGSRDPVSTKMWKCAVFLDV